jgi:hypothetical protein
MTRETIYMSQDYFLEKIYIPTKKMKGQKPFVYREVSYKGKDFEVREYDELPDWYVRELKLDILLNEESNKLG